MKKYLLFLSSFLLLYSCTLSMEDYELPEDEQQGFDEPCTVTNDLGSVTYQYNDGVIYVSERAQEYLAQVEHDTILYFMNNIPEELRPAVGAKLASGCTRKLPMGLNHKVLSVEDVGGFLKVVCTVVPTEEVYKELSYCYDAEMGYADVSELDDETLEKLGYQRHDSIIIDWALHDSVMGINTEQLEARRMALRKTRSDDDPIKKETGSDGINKNEFIDFYFDSRNIGKLAVGLGQTARYLKDYTSAIEKQLASQKKKHPFLDNLYLGVGLNITHYERVHAEKDERKKYELNYSDTWTEGKVKVEVGVEVSKTPDSELSQDKIGTNLRSWQDGAKKWVVLANSMGEHFIDADMVPEKDKNKSWGTPKLRVVLPTGPVPLAFIAQATLNPEISIKGCIAASATYKTDTRRTGYEVKNGKKTHINKTVEKGSLHFDNVSINGSFKVGASFRAYAGLELAGSLACTVGANVECFFEAEGKLTFAEEKDDDSGERSICEPSGSARFYVDFYGDLRLHVAPLGIQIWEKQLLKFLTVHLIDFNSKMEPNIYYNQGKCIATEEKINATAYFKLKEADGLNCFTRFCEYRPAMLMYLGPINNNNYVVMLLDSKLSESTLVKAGKTYHFYYDGDFSANVGEVHFRPAFSRASDITSTQVFPKIILASTKDATMCEIGNPSISTVGTLQVLGRPSFDYTFFDDGTKSYVDMKNGEYGGEMSVDPSQVSLRQYKYMTILNVLNGSRMSKWGVKVKIFGPSGKCLMRRKVPVNKAKTGRYTLIFSFMTDWKKPDGVSEKMSILMQPYWEDINGGAKGEADDNLSLKKWPIEYELLDEDGDYADKTLKPSETDGYFGKICPEIDLE